MFSTELATLLCAVAVALLVVILADLHVRLARHVYAGACNRACESACARAVTVEHALRTQSLPPPGAENPLETD